MKKIAIFGGSGNTGLCAVDAALKKGKEVNTNILTILVDHSGSSAL